MTQAKSEKVVQEIRQKTRRWFSYTLEPAVINGHLLNQLLLDSQIQLLKFVGEVIAVDQIDGRARPPRTTGARCRLWPQPERWRPTSARPGGLGWHT